MTKAELTAAVDGHIETTHDALQAVYDALNQGQRKKLMKNAKIKALFARYGVAEEVS